MEIKVKDLHETRDLSNLSYLELKLLRSSLQKWNGDLSLLDKDLILIDEELLTTAYKNLLKRLHLELRTALIKN